MVIISLLDIILISASIIIDERFNWIRVKICFKRLSLPLNRDKVILIKPDLLICSFQLEDVKRLLNPSTRLSELAVTKIRNVKESSYS